MPRFEVVGIGRETGRKRVRIYEVTDKETAIMAAAADGTIVDVEKIRELPETPASERQIEYAKKYGIKVPHNATMKQLSEVLTRAENENWPTLEEKNRARRLGIEIPIGITDDELDNLIYEKENEIEAQKELEKEKKEDARFQAQLAQISQIKTSQSFSPGVAAVMSFIIPGLGQMYKGQIINGLVWFFVVLLGYALYIIPGIILHLFCIVGAASNSNNKTSG